MRESYRFRTGSGRIVVMVPDHAVRSVDGRENAWRESAVREHPFGRSALGRARDDFWRSPGSGNTYTIDLGMLPSPGRALGFEKPGELAMPPWDDIPFLRDIIRERERQQRERDEQARDRSKPATPTAAPGGPGASAAGLALLGIEVMGELGAVVQDAVLTIGLPDGEQRTLALDASGRGRVDGIAIHGACAVALLTPVMLVPPAFAPGEFPRFDALVAYDRPTVLSLATGRTHRIGVARPCARLIELSDVSFPSAGVLLRPEAHNPADGSDGLAGLTAALAHAFADPDVRLLVAGHADTVGGDGDNAALSLERARNVQLLLAGRRAEWAAHSQAHYTVGDFEAAYRFVAQTFGWDCDPGKVDDDFDDASRGARDRFRVRYTAETGQPLQRHVKQNDADWAAIFDQYQRALSDKLGLTPETLAVQAGTLRFVEVPAVGCGESFPNEAPDHDGFASASNRRVDVVLVQANDLPYLGSPPDVARLYGATRLFRRIGIYVPRAGEILGTFVSQLVDEQDRPVAGERYELTLPDGTMIEGRLDAQGFVRHSGVPLGPCKLAYPDLDAREWGGTPVASRPLPERPPETAGNTTPDDDDGIVTDDSDLDSDLDSDFDGEIEPDDDGVGGDD